MNTTRLPLIPLELIEFLEAQFPPAEYQTGDTLEILAYRGGQRKIVRYLRQLYDEQAISPHDKILED